MKYAIVKRDQEKSLVVANYIQENLNMEMDDVNPDIVIAVGGDGTLLVAAHQYPHAIIFGVHTGHLGFYTNYDADKDLDMLIDDINKGDYHIEGLDILEAEFSDKNGNFYQDFAMNEFTIVCPPRTLRLDVYIDDVYFERFRGTGFSVCTPYGSTAYNKSLDGSVVDNSVSVMQLTEIAGINSNAYRTLSSPLILSSERRIRLEVKEKDVDVFITADNKSYQISEFEKISIKYHKNAVKLAYTKHENFLTRINRTFIISKD